MKLNQLTLRQAIDKLQKKEISHADLYKDIYGAIAEKNEQYNIYLSKDVDAVAKAEKLLKAPLAGVPIAVKDNYLTKGLPTTAATKLLEGFLPPYESTPTSRLMKAGAVVIGKTNLDAWAHGSSTETSDFGPTKNPRNSAHLPGGSSGGSAAAVAADMCIGAIGSETAGSTRLPAAWCGVVGVKPTYGRVSRAGVIAMGSSLDSPGPIAKTVQDSAILLEHMAGKDRYDATTAEKAVPQYETLLKKNIKGFKVGLCYVDHAKLKGTLAAKTVLDAAKVLERLGAVVDLVPMAQTLKPKTILNPDYAIGVYTIIQRSEVSSNLARYDGIRYGHDRSYFSAEAKRRIMLGTLALSRGYADQYYTHAQQVRSLFIKNYTDLFSRYDALISPVSASVAPLVGSTVDNPMFGEVEDMLLEHASISGNPGISVPCYRDEATNLYLGLNIVTNHWQEEKMFQIAFAYEQATSWNSWSTP